MATRGPSPNLLAVGRFEHQECRHHSLGVRVRHRAEHAAVFDRGGGVVPVLLVRGPVLGILDHLGYQRDTCDRGCGSQGPVP